MTSTASGTRLRIAAVITCADGFKLSVIAGPGTYCLPKPTLWADLPTETGELSHDYPGPYTHVEVGYPSDVPEPWTCHHRDSDYCGPAVPNGGFGWECYAETASDPTGTVYGFVPVAMVAALIAAHGGET